MIPTAELPQTATIYSPSGTEDDFGDVGGSTQVYTGIKCRVTRNKNYNPSSLSEAGYVTKSTHVIFMNLSQGGVDTNLELGYSIVVSSRTYKIHFIDTAPGGVENHHQQIYAERLVQ